MDSVELISTVKKLLMVKSAVGFLILFVSLLAITTMQPANALEISYPVVNGPNGPFSFRDILNTDPTADPVITLTPSNFHIGDLVTLTINDFNGNLDPASPDQITATLNGAPITLDETGGVNSGIFTYQFTAGVNTNISYDQLPNNAVRAEITLNIDQPGTVTFRDVFFTDDQLNNFGFDAITHGLEIEFSDGATLAIGNSDDIVVVISYANADLELGESPDDIFVLWDEDGVDNIGFGFDDLTAGFTADPVAETVSSDPPTVVFPCSVDCSGGQYVLSLGGSGAGGGAGGLVRPGLVLNFLAGTLAGAGGKDTTPPSLTRSISSGVQFDPFSPIEPTGDSLDDSSQQAPLRINGNDYPLYGYSNTIVKNTIETGQFIDMSLVFEEASKVEHVAMYFVDQGSDEYSDTDPVLLFDNGNIAKADPEGIFGDDIQLSTSKEGTKSIFNFGVSFDKPTNKNLMIVAWDDKRNSGMTKIFNAIEVVGNAIPNEVAHFMPIEALGEFELVKNDNGQYVLSEQVETQTVTSDSPKSTVYPEFIGRLERHDLRQLYDAISNEQQKASYLMVGKFNLDISHRFVADDEVKPYDMARRASELTQCGNKIGCGLDRENKEIIQKLLWQEHLKAEKTLKSLFVGSKYNQD